MVALPAAGVADANQTLTDFVASGAVARTTILSGTAPDGKEVPVACLMISMPVAEGDLFSIVAKAALGLHFLGHLPG